MAREAEMKYVLIFYGGGMPESPAAQARVLKQWNGWYERLGPAVIDAGLPFSGAVRKIDPDGTASKGAIGKRATGYAIVEASTIDLATRMAKSCPILKSEGSVAVYETAEAM
jgi:hypothetical protein